MRWLAVSDGLVRTCLAKGSNYCHYYNERPLKFFQTRALLKILYLAIVNKTEVFLFSLQTYEELSTPQHPAFLPSNVMLSRYANAVTEWCYAVSILLFLTVSKPQKTSVTAFTRSVY